MRYDGQEPRKPRGLTGMSDGQLDQHWHLYEAYVKNPNERLEAIETAEHGSRVWGELTRRLGFEFNGMVLHEDDFANLAAGAALSPGSELAGALAVGWGDIPAWREDFAPAGRHPLLVLDVFEHAWMVDDGAGEKGTYVEAFLENVSWEIVEQRVAASANRMAPARGSPTPRRASRPVARPCGAM